MTREDLIKQLKESKTSPHFWSDEMWGLAKTLGNNFEYFNNGQWIGMSNGFLDKKNDYDLCYRLRPDYKESSEIDSTKQIYYCGFLYELVSNNGEYLILKRC